MFSKGRVTQSRTSASGSDTELLSLRQQIELGRFLQEQIQDQAAAMIQLGSDLVARPSHQMVAAMACSWLVQHFSIQQAVIVGRQDDSLVVYALYPPDQKAGVLQEILAEKTVQEAAHHGVAFSSQTSVNNSITKLFKGACVEVLPLQVPGSQLGCLILSGDMVFESDALAGEISRALSLASALAELGVQTQKLRELDTVRNSFIATTSHQLRTPLSIIKWMFSVFLSDPELAKMDKQMQMIKQAYSGVERVVDVVNDLLNVSRIQDGKLPYSPQVTDPTKIITEIIEEIKPIAESRAITLSLTVTDTLPQCTFDPILLREALRNIINNAIDYNHDKGSIEVGAKVQGSHLTITVSNTGIGILPEEENRIFVPLYRGSEAVLLRPDGSGLGLYLAKAIAVAHGGELSFTSQPGKMTTFSLDLPLQPNQIQ